MKEMICIVCPKGCHLTVTAKGDTFAVSGNECPRGEKYAIEEMTCPKRMVPSTVRIEGGLLHRLPVITDQPIEKKYIGDLMKALNGITVNAPIQQGDVIFQNIFDTKVNIVASRSMM
jgi:CxxC motif-containing protein